MRRIVRVVTPGALVLLFKNVPNRAEPSVRGPSRIEKREGKNTGENIRVHAATVLKKIHPGRQGWKNDIHLLFPRTHTHKVTL